MKLLTALVLLFGLFAFAGCEEKAAPTKPAEETHSDDDGHDHADGEHTEGDGHDDHEGHDH